MIPIFDATIVFLVFVTLSSEIQRCCPVLERFSFLTQRSCEMIYQPSSVNQRFALLIYDPVLSDSMFLCLDSTIPSKGRKTG